MIEDSRFSAGVERTALLAIVLAVYAAYFPISLMTREQQGHSPALWIDHATPLSPSWIFVYALVFLAGLLPIFVVADRRLFRRVALAYFVFEIVSYALFFIYPVHMTLRPETVASDSFVMWGLRLCYFVDVPSNCFPSMHVGMAILAGLCCWPVDRAIATAGLVVAFAIAASTMLVKQHFLLDVLGGFALAVAMYFIFVARHRVDGEALRYSRWRPMILVGIYGASVGACYVAYQSGWRPWEA